MDHSTELEYVGFWLRAWASAIDLALVALIALPTLLMIYGPDYLASRASSTGPFELLVTWVLPIVAVSAFWMSGHATPGKMVIAATIIDERTGAPPSLGQYIARWLGFVLAVVPFGLGFLWIAFDVRKQGLHDKLAGTLVVRVRKNHEPVRYGH